MIYALILSGGSGTRFGNNLPKQFSTINNKSILQYSINNFNKHKLIEKIIIVSNPNFIEETNKILANNNFNKVVSIIKGGKTRGESAYLGLQEIQKNENISSDLKVLIHDSVRPNTSELLISGIINELKHFEAVSPAIQVTDTIYFSENLETISKIPQRKNIFKAQTPQAFQFATIYNSYQKIDQNIKFSLPDDCAVVNAAFPEIKIKIVEGDNNNLKITFKEDLEIFRQIIGK